MRISSILLFIVGLQVYATGYSQSRISMNAEGMSIREALKQIEKQTDFRFFYSDDLVFLDQTTNLNVSNLSVDEVLNQLFKASDVGYRIFDNTVIVSVKEQLRQGIQISGTVTEAGGTTIPGANVTVKGTTIGVVTDANGKYAINVPNRDAVLVFSFVGFVTVEVPMGELRQIDILLVEDSQQIEEVIVVGYGVQRKTSSTAAVGVIGGDVLENIPVANLSQALGGQIPGLITAQNSGEIGNDQVNIRIRGIGTNGGTSPLFVIDGVVSQTSSFNLLDVNNIQSITVLKDAAAVAPYGMAGANGVIIITSKKGNVGKPKLSYSGNYGFQSPTFLTDMLNAYEYATLRNVAIHNQNPTQPLPYTDEQLQGYKKSVDGAPDADYDKYPNTNIYDIIQNTSPISQHHVSLSGGSEFATYYVGVGYQYQQGLWSSVQSNRYNLHSSVEMRPTNTTKVALSLKGYNRVINRPSASGTSIFTNAQAYLPIHPVYYSNGYLGASVNIVIPDRLKSGKVTNDVFSSMIQLSVEQELPFVKGLKINGLIDFNIDKTFIKSWSEPALTYYNINTSTTPYTYTPVVSTEKPALSESIVNYQSNIFQGIVNYDRIFNKHAVSLLLVMETRTTKRHNVGAGRTNYNISIPELNLGSPDQTFWSNSGTTSESAQVGYVYRLGYQYDNKYLFEASGRYDGHYYFAPGKRFGFFPSFSLGWNIDQEQFFNISWIDRLKIRGSWGQSGNLAGNPFQYSSGMTVFNNAYVYGGTIMQGIYETLEPNPNITWEKANKYNLGFETWLWNRFLSLEFDIFYERRNNMLITPDAIIPAEYGIGIAQANDGVMENRGIDFILGSSHLFSNGIGINASFNFTYAKNKLIEVAENVVTKNDPNRTRTGRPLNTPFGLKAERLYQVDDFLPNGTTLKPGLSIPTFGPIAPGDIMWADVNNDGKVDASDETALGYPRLPHIIYGFNFSISYKGFELNPFFQGAFQSNVFIQSHMAYPFLITANAPKAALDYWTPENTDATYPRIYGSGGSTHNMAQRYGNDWFKRSGAYLRLKNIQFGYNIPQSILKGHIQSVKLLISGQNLLTFSHTKGFFDPEMDQGGINDSNERGWYHPQLKTITFGINVTF